MTQEHKPENIVEIDRKERQEYKDALHEAIKGRERSLDEQYEGIPGAIGQNRSGCFMFATLLAFIFIALNVVGIIVSFLEVYFS
ncbi:MAG: hypothetical protein WCT26_04560 [Candidatus Buchananbacteria bacterium]|jgi:hypothetical protein